MRVNIYTYNTVRGPGKKRGSYTIILEAIVNRSAATKTMQGEVEGSEISAELQVALIALSRMTKRSEVTFYTECSQIATGATQWMEKWIAAGWQNSKKKPVGNLELWQELHKKLQEQDITWKVKQGHTYRNWMIEETNKAEERRKACLTDSES